MKTRRGESRQYSIDEGICNKEYKGKTETNWEDQEHMFSTGDAQQAFSPKGGTHASATRKGWNCSQLG